MPYLNLDLDYFTHRKVVKLVGLLGQDVITAPLRLWCYAGKYYPATGMLQAMLVSEIEEVANWKGKSGLLVEKMVQIKFLDKLKNSYRIHDWKEHAGHLQAFKIRAKSAAKARWKDLATSNRQAMLRPPVSNAPNHPNHPNLPNQPLRKDCVKVKSNEKEGEPCPDEAREKIRKILPDFGLKEIAT